MDRSLPSVCRLVAVVCLTASVALPGCRRQKVVIVADDSAAWARPIPILRHYDGSDPAFYYPDLILVRSKAQLDEMGSLDLIQQDIDFETEAVLVLALGEQPTTGFWTRIHSVQRQGDALFIQGTANRPARDQAGAPLLTYPYDAVVIRRADAEGVAERDVRGEVGSVVGMDRSAVQTPAIEPAGPEGADGAGAADSSPRE